MASKNRNFQNWVVLTSVGEIRSLNGVPGDAVVVVGEPATGSFWFDVTDTTSSDNGRTIIVATDGGRWKMIRVDADAVDYQPGSASAYSDGTVGAELNALSAEIALLMTANFYAGETSDDALALQTFAHFNQAKRIILNSTTMEVDFYTNCLITDSGGTTIALNNNTVVQHTPNTDSFVVAPLTVGSTAAFLNNVIIDGPGTISHSGVAAASTEGFGLKATQCSGVQARGVIFSNADVQIAGCQLWRLPGCSFFAGASGAAGRGINSGLVYIVDAPYGSGSFQQCFTGEIDQWNASANQLRGALFAVQSVDGLTIGKGNGNSASRALVNLKSARNGSYISNVKVAPGAYLDCGPLGGCPFGVLLSADSNSASLVYSVDVDCWMGNASLSGFANRKPESQGVKVAGFIYNCTSYGIDHSVTGDLADIEVGHIVFEGNGTNGVSGDIRLDGGHSFIVSPCIYTNTTNVCITVTNTWVAGKVSPGVNATGTAADIAYSSATFTGSPMVLDAGASSYVGTVANSWKYPALSLNTYANDGAAAAAGLQVGRLYNDASGFVHRRLT